MISEKIEKLYFKDLSSNFFFYVLIFIILFSLYQPILFTNAVVNPDYALVTSPMTSVHSFLDYIKAIKINKILDIQPIRDLSLAIDIYLARLVGVRIFEASNLLIWLFSTILLYKIFLLFNLNLLLSRSLILIYTIYPTFVHTVSWASARKHLLAYLFILAATYLALKSLKNKTHKTKDIILIYLFYLSAIFSQPIVLLWPLWYLLVALVGPAPFKIPESDRKKIIQISIPLIIILIINTTINYYYYNYIYITAVGTSKYILQYDVLGVKFLSIGRSFFQFVYPFVFAITYDPGSIANIIGLFLLLIFYYLFWKSYAWKNLIVWGSLFFLPLFIVLFRMTKIFLSDSYLLLSSVSFFIMILLLAQKIIPFLKVHLNYSIIFYILIFSLFLITSRNEINLRTTEEAFVIKSYQREKSCTNIIMQIKYLWSISIIPEALSTSEEFFKKNCQLSLSDHSLALMGKIAFYNSNISVNEKLEHLKSLKEIDDKNFFVNILLASTYLKNGQASFGIQLFSNTLSDTSTIFDKSVSFDPIINAVIEDFNNLCSSKWVSINSISSECKILEKNLCERLKYCHSHYENFLRIFVS
ncbi:MAG: hypothetical protein HQK51_02315 [Oligoflexia bacterium]|nr:hypothetical protein [Oligoflexia bacterium]